MKVHAGSRRGSRAASAALALILLLGSTPAGAFDLAEESARFQEWAQNLGRYYDEHPELQRGGSGWKPYHRTKWFYERRMQDGLLPPPGARWDVWRTKRELERRSARSVQARWFSLGPTNLAGRMLALAFHPSDPSIVYAGGADGGVWKSTDSGASWIPMSDELPSIAVGGIAVLPANPNVVVIGTGEATQVFDAVRGVGILRSTDAGVTWNTTSLSYPVSSTSGFHVVRANPATGTLLAGENNGLWRSDDEGETWTQVKAGGWYTDIAWKPGDPNRVYAVKGLDSQGNNVKVSTDDGVTWSKAGTGQPPTFAIGKSKLAVSAADPSVIYAAFATNSVGANTMTGIYRSTDDGATWTPRNTDSNPGGGFGQYDYNLVLVADPNNVQRVIFGGVNLRRSTDGAATFSTIGGNVHVDHHAIAYEPGSDSRLWVGCDGGIWRSTDDGSTWTDRNQGLVTYQFYDICVNNGPTEYYLMGGTQDNGTDKWSGTTAWGEGLGGDGMVCNINPINGTTVYAEIQFGNHHKNTNSGIGGWNAIMNGITGTGDWVAPVDEDQNTGNHLYTATADGIFRTTSGGNSWTRVATHRAVWISISPVDGNVVWTVHGGAPRYTTDDGASWLTSSAYGFLTGAPSKILADPVDVNRAFVTFSGYGAGIAHIAMTTDLGGSWADVTGDFPSQPVNGMAVDPQNPDRWFLATDVGVWASTDGGSHWAPFEIGLPNAVIADIEIQNALRKLVVGTHGRGAWEIDISRVQVPRSAEGPDSHPPARAQPDVRSGPSALHLLLDPPTPNPARSEVWLRFAAKHEGPVTLGVYDVQGRQIADLSERAQGDGIIRTLSWIADDVPSGVYFAVLRAGPEQTSRKIVINR